MAAKLLWRHRSPFLLTCLHPPSPSSLVPPTDLRIDGSTLWVRCNLQQRVGTNTFSHNSFPPPPKLIFCYAYKAKIINIITFLVTTSAAVVISQKCCTHFFLSSFWTVEHVSVMQTWQIQNLTSAEANDFKGCFYTWWELVRQQWS